MVKTQILLDKYEIEDPNTLRLIYLQTEGPSTVGDKWQATNGLSQYDEKTARLLQRGDVLGVTQAESRNA